MKIRPCRNRISRFVASEMRYFHRPFAMSVLSCCTSIIALVSALLSLLNYVGRSSDDGTGSRTYLNMSIGLLIALFAAYIVYSIIKWGRLPSYSLVMSFTAVNYAASGFGGFLLSRSVLYDMLEESVEGGFEYFLNNILRWSFWAPAAIILLFFAASFVKSKTGNHDGGWWYVIFTFLPLSIIPFVSFVMRLEIEKENFVTVTSISVMVYITIMLSIAARYAVKAVMNKFLSDMPVFEDAVVVKSAYRVSDGKRIFWWEKKPPVSETDEAEKDAETVPASKLGAFLARFAAWFKRIFALSAPPDITKPGDDSVSDAAPSKKAKKTSKKSKPAQDGSEKTSQKQKSQSTEPETKPEKQNDKEQAGDVEQAGIIKSDKGTKSKPKKQKTDKQKDKKVEDGVSVDTDKPEPLADAGSGDAATSSDDSGTGDISGEVTVGGKSFVPKSPKLAEILARLKSKNKENSNGSDNGTAEDSETESAAESPEPAVGNKPEAAESSEENSEQENSETADEKSADSETTGEESTVGVVANYNLPDADTDTDSEQALDALPEEETAEASDTSTSENGNTTTPSEIDELLHRAVGAINAAIDSHETYDSDDNHAEVAAGGAETEDTVEEADGAELQSKHDVAAADHERNCGGCGSAMTAESTLCQKCGLYQPQE